MTTEPDDVDDVDDSELDRSLDSPGARYGERFRTNISAESLQARVIEAEARSLARTFEELSRTGEVAHAAALILGARRRYITGRGKTAAYAELLNADLSTTLSNVFLVDGRALSPLTVLTDVRASDVLVAFTMRRYREETVRFGQLFHEAGGQLILITDSENAPLTGVAAAVIRVHTHSASFADSPTAVAAVCHLLSTLTTASAKGARRRLAGRDRFAADLGLYHPEQNKETDA
ncbi:MULTISPECIES: SIS domain-containing protein [unclassified Microbacterium]|uniref:MurR/RpiR family transcriptional regulator n=1 Tax=unclassified Microbacterium TaxID=2609290 RepID=UPI00214C14E8|nr:MULTISPECIES: SIS domain-containing protein [unclassified Microbacterium]MCR2784725.1 SIS domain-containing protein [Microbacterium sp. zg.B96]MDL5352820.1 SIS domain-containing protein [Microbacterium sp. zg-YB36]WIM16264.1 SIS domain-containing protein [Microbacterium sp. zg-B96]